MCFTLNRCYPLIAGILIAALIVVAISAATSAVAAPPSAGDAALFDRLDADKNQALAADEVPSEHERLFTRLLRRGDANHDDALSRDEFLTALVPSRPEKPLETKQPSMPPQAAAVRYLLLSMDTSLNSRIEANEVPEGLQPVLNVMLERIDSNDNNALDRQELTQNFPALTQIAGRYAQRERIDVTRELRKLEKAQGAAADRFDRQRPMMENLGDPNQARAMFAELDGNGDGQIESGEVPEPFEQRLEGMLRRGDRDGDNRLSEREFLAITERLSRFLQRRRPAEMPARGEMRQRDEMPAESMPAEDR